MNVTRQDIDFLFNSANVLYRNAYKDLDMTEQALILDEWYQTLKNHDWQNVRQAFILYKTTEQYGYLHIGVLSKYIEQVEERAKDLLPKPDIIERLSPKLTDDEKAKADLARKDCMKRLQKFKRGEQNA